MPGGVDASGPAKEDVAGGLHHALALYDALTVLLEAALGQVLLEHRGCRFLDLQEQRVLVVAALQQDDEGAGSYTSDTYHLPCHVDDLEAFEEVSPVGLQRGSIR